MNKQRKIDTLNELASIRVKYPTFKMIANQEKIEYIQRMEFFALGVNEGIYDISIVKKMSRKVLINQYDNEISEFFSNNKIQEYKELKKMINDIR